MTSLIDQYFDDPLANQHVIRSKLKVLKYRMTDGRLPDDQIGKVCDALDALDRVQAAMRDAENALDGLES